MPRNAATSSCYRGGNVLSLWGAQLKHGYLTEYRGNRQWAGLGRQVVRGQKATYCLKWVDRTRGDDAREPDTRGRERRAFPVGFALFNADQTDAAAAFDGVTWEAPVRVGGVDPIPGCAAFFERIGAHIVSGSPAYSPSSDTITLPALGAFDDPEAYYATRAHEHAHWTGHSSRLARDLSGKFGSDSYAAEELVAALAAAHVAATLGIETQPRLDHAQYLASWIRELRADSRALYRAARSAQAAADYLLTCSQRVEILHACGSNEAIRVGVEVAA